MNYKNYKAGRFQFTPKFNFFTGLNGSGKTNLLDALYYICITKSANTARDRHVTQFGEEFFRIAAEVTIADRTHEVVAKVKPGKLKEISVDSVALDRLSDHIGFQSIIFLAPGDQVLVEGASAERRKFLDFYLSQTDKDYLFSIMQYNRLLTQRNALLKEFGRRADVGLLDNYAERMTSHWTKIVEARKKFVDELNPLVVDIVAEVSYENDQVSLGYAPDVPSAEGTLHTVLSQVRERDMILGRTTRGAHRDDITFSLEGTPLKRFGSQGQRKSYLIALHLALYRYLNERCEEPPVILLDDIFDKLDDQRILALLNILGHDNYGQVFITDARPERVREVCNVLDAPGRVFEISHGSLKSEYEFGRNRKLGTDEEE